MYAEGGFTNINGQLRGYLVALNTVTGAPLPGQLTAFTATAAGPTAVRLAWATASEKNSARFEVERSTEGRSFARIGTVAAAGNSSRARTYGFADTAPPLYHLLSPAAGGPGRQLQLLAGALRAKGETGLALFPNPAPGGAATLTGAQPGTVVTMYDALGRFVTSATADTTGPAALALPAGSYPVGLPTGVYVVRAGSKALRLTVA